MSIDLKGVAKAFGQHSVVRDVNLHIPTGKITALLGPSGAGKTTLLRIIAGLEQPTAGDVMFDGRNVANVAPGSRRIGYVFQHYALFRNMTVFENVAFGLRVKPRRVRPGEAEIRATVEDLLDRVQLTGSAMRYPRELSGGQRQRVAFARALAIAPRFLLLDEPFGALDTRIRHELRGWLRELHSALSLTTILVTHDHDEAREVADHFVFVEGGTVIAGTQGDLPKREHRFIMLT